MSDSRSLPLVSIIISTYNRPELLERAIASAIAQDYENVEIIVSDDCSTYDIVKQIKDINKHSHIEVKLIRNKSNRGACYTRNKGIEYAKGFFIAGLDDDDEFTHNRISLLYRQYSSEYSFITSNTLVITKTKTFNLFHSKKNELISVHDMLWENKIGTQCFIERSKIIACNGFDEELTASQDADMWIRLIEAYGPALRIHEIAYILHTEHDAPRITSSKKKVDGLILYKMKHQSKMSKAQRAYSDFIISLWSNEKVKAISKLNVGAFIYMIRKFFLIITR